jgi:hypothetical protein
MKENELARSCNMHGEMKNSNKILVGKAEEKRPLKRLGVCKRTIFKWRKRK